MIAAATRLLDRVTRGRGERLLRYGTASVAGVVLSQCILLTIHGIMNEEAVLANVLAVLISVGPVFYINKRWVWGIGGRAQVRREVVPFLLLTLLGLLVSTLLVAIVDRYTDRTWPVMAANIAGFGIVWVAKFLFLDQIVFGHHLHQQGEDAVADAR